MRLLNARTKTLEEFFDDNIPRYAILSHTWGPNEPTYRDFAAPGNRDANVKIDGCCERALLDGYEYVWIDTICIDKSSSAELSEAINSMYTWYESAGVCYAYLSDVSSDHDTPVAQLAHPDTDFRRSKWFTRGWTLQELIAPRKVVFYNFRWLRIMEKRTRGNWHSVLEKITGIPCEVLDGSASLTKITVAARMTWAANRRTTRKEDIAYCLLGIFKINMSMLYGEGDRAFTRLQEEIIRTSDDESIFAWGFKNGNTPLVHILEAKTPCQHIIP
ncbi:heterokaryon incompatibility protein-domain-containing protein [Schizothecium vesticola]|uniref:Heterokaryon incompatibility protein-domain-containing protein n=1 Tax=Schizothecium vesticola TaxID=314040 RepID=A0AA40EWF6_9PEZI|nr:heterokaryon incompatibility protein-domain-containing protein [Schizothecium vesticola]